MREREGIDAGRAYKGIHQNQLRRYRRRDGAEDIVRAAFELLKQKALGRAESAEAARVNEGVGSSRHAENERRAEERAKRSGAHAQLSRQYHERKRRDENDERRQKRRARRDGKRGYARSRTAKPFYK